MSNEPPLKKIGFASFFTSVREAPVDLPSPVSSPPPSYTTSHSNGRSLNHVAAAPKGSKHSRSASPEASRTLSTAVSGRGRSLPKSSSTKRNFKCILDPELEKTLAKGSKPVIRYDGKSVCHPLSGAAFTESDCGYRIQNSSSLTLVYLETMP